jgi:HD-GYP domain-containing protein (c-di-GMP phosphodiesterase class II)
VDLLGPLSIVADLGFGLPPQLGMRSSLVSAALGRRLGLSEEDAMAAFYTPLLMHIGCISMSHETAAIFGNEIAITRAVAMTNLSDPHDILETFVPEATKGLSEGAKEETSELILTQGESFGKQYDAGSTEVARQTARRIGLADVVQRALFECSESWEGTGAPQGLKGEQISLAARIARVASDAAFFNHIGGPETAVQAVRARSGTIHDPAIAREFIEHPTELLTDANCDEPSDRLLEVDPRPVVEMDQMHMTEVMAAFGNAADLKTPYTHGHSGATAQVAGDAGERANLSPGVVANLRLASFIHDVGRVAISDLVWEKPAPLNTSEWEQVRMHAYHAERILGRSRYLDPLARIVGMHHERLDGSGYHRGSRASEIPMAARILAVSDAWVSMQQPRPHRLPMDPDRAAAELLAECREGGRDVQAAEAVLDATGHRPRTARDGPAGLSRREVEVLRLVAAGCSNPEIASRLHIARRTAEHHVQHIYTKIGVSTRPGAALFAVENDLLEPTVG